MLLAVSVSEVHCNDRDASVNPSAAVDFYSAAQDRLNDSTNGLHLTMPFPMRNHIAAAMRASNGYLYFHFGTGLYAFAHEIV